MMKPRLLPQLFHLKRKLGDILTWAPFSMVAMKEDISVTTFREYLRIPTVHPEPNYEPAVQFLCNLSKDIGLQCQVVRPLPNKPVVIMTWQGKDPSLSTVVLNSHMDVVQVFPEHWKHDPFDAHKDEKGNIYGRGAQDMKCTGIQYVEAIRRLKAKGSRLLRTVHVTFMPDEEIGGHTGMALFVRMPEFQALNLGVALDESAVNEDDIYRIVYGERVKWHLKVCCLGNPGHGSRFTKNTAAEKLQMVINKFLAFREEQRQVLNNNPDLALGDVVTVNLTILSGGVQVNVVPAEISAEFDIRVTPWADYDKLMKMFESWVEDAGAKFEWVNTVMLKTTTVIDDSNPWWTAMAKTMKSLDLRYKPGIDIGSTDLRYIRQLGYPAFGFTAVINTPQLLHSHDEYLNEKEYIKGMEIYTHLIPALANMPAF